MGAFARTLTLAALLAGSFALTAGSAGAAVTVGENCTVSGGVAGSLLQTASVGNKHTFPSDGVITKFSMTMPLGYPGGYSASIKIFRSKAPDTFTVTGSSVLMALTPGASTMLTRVPVTAGDILGTSGAPGALYCAAAPTGNAMSHTPTVDPPVGSDVTISPTADGTLMAGAVTVEADADKDGYGDETQDGCPQSATTQAVCPLVDISARFLAPTPKLLQLFVAGVTPATVTVQGEIKIKPATSRKKAKTIKFTSKRTVNPGQLASFKLKFPKSLRAALKTYPKSKKFKLKVTVSASGLANTDTIVKRFSLRGTK